MLYHCEAHCQLCFVTFQVYLVAEKTYFLVIFLTFASHLCDITGNSGKVHLSIFSLQRLICLLSLCFFKYLALVALKAHLSIFLP